MLLFNIVNADDTADYAKTFRNSWIEDLINVSPYNKIHFFSKYDLAVCFEITKGTSEILYKIYPYIKIYILQGIANFRVVRF